MLHKMGENYYIFWTFAVAGLFFIISLLKFLQNQSSKSSKNASKLPPGGRSWPLIGDSIKWYSAVSSSHPPRFVEEQVKRYANEKKQRERWETDWLILIYIWKYFSWVQYLLFYEPYHLSQRLKFDKFPLSTSNLKLVRVPQKSCLLHFLCQVSSNICWLMSILETPNYPNLVRILIFFPS